LRHSCPGEYAKVKTVAAVNFRDEATGRPFESRALAIPMHPGRWTLAIADSLYND